MAGDLPELTAAQENRARRLHARCVVVDLMSQRAGANIFGAYPPPLQAELQALLAQPGTLYQRYMRANNWPYELALAGRSDLIFDWYRQAGVTVITHSIPVGADPLDDLDTTRFAALPWLRHVTTAAEMHQAKADGVIASYANYQPLGAIPNDLSALDEAYAKGLRSLMLTYNSMTTAGVGCTERVDAGLSRHGVQIVARCNALGIIVDTSHCGVETTLDACRVSTRPVTANHTSARTVYRHARGKTDECLRAIAGTGGVIGVYAVPAYLTDATVPTLGHMLDHIDHIANLVGWQHVALGTDWPLQAPIEVQRPLFTPDNKDTAFRPDDRLDVSVNLRGLDDVRDLPNVTRGLVQRGWCDEEIAGILGENALRVFAAVCG